MFLSGEYVKHKAFIIFKIRPRVKRFFMEKNTSYKQKFSEIFLSKMRVYRINKRSDREISPFRLGGASAWLRWNVAGLASLRPLILKCNFNGLRADSRSKHSTESSSVLSYETSKLNDKFLLISRSWKLAGFTEKKWYWSSSSELRERSSDFW